MQVIFGGALLSLIIIAAAPAEALLKTDSPPEVCASLKDVGLAARSWRNLHDTSYGCSSPYKEIGSGNPLANTLAFYANGDRSTVALVYLVLNVNVPALAAAAHGELLKAADVLVERATGAHLTASLREAITIGAARTGRVGGAAVEVVRKNWPTGRGYELHVIIK
jgi:hypothetical protein